MSHTLTAYASKIRGYRAAQACLRVKLFMLRVQGLALRKGKLETQAELGLGSIWKKESELGFGLS